MYCLDAPRFWHAVERAVRGRSSAAHRDAGMTQFHLARIRERRLYFLEDTAMHYRNMIVAAAAFIAAGVASCGDHPTAPTSPEVQTASPADASAQAAPNAEWSHKQAKSRAALLTDVPVAGKLSDGGSFVGTLTARHLDIDPVTRALSMTGTLVGTATTADGRTVAITQQFTAPMTLARSAGGAAGIANFHPAAMVSCDVLFLDLGPLHLDLLGLTVDLAEVILDVNAVTGSGNLLGNLLCAVLGLLDIPGAIAGILQLLDTINAILAGLNPGAVTGAALMLPAPFTASPAVVMLS